MIATLPVTLLVEGLLGFVYALWRRKPVVPILITSLFANLVTQSLLWLALNLFFQHYLATLLISEVLIWMLESLFLYALPANRLRLGEAILLSLGMNLASFAAGWFLPM